MLSRLKYGNIFDRILARRRQEEQARVPKIYFIDITNRDTVQASRIIMAKLQKTMVNLCLAEMGIHQSELSFPFAKH
ncbi:hypothetical protein ACFLST_01955 [Chloroflexota bacterium]